MRYNNWFSDKHIKQAGLFTLKPWFGDRVTRLSLLRLSVFYILNAVAVYMPFSLKLFFF